MKHALALIFVHEREQRSAAATATAPAGRQEIPHRQAGEEHHRDPAQQHHRRGAEVGLDEDQRDRGRSTSAAAGHSAAPAPDVAGREQVVEAREDEHDRRLHEFGRLEADEAEVEPALRALADEADHLDDDQQDEDHDIGREGHLLDEILRDPRHADRDRRGRTGSSCACLSAQGEADPPAAE